MYERIRLSQSHFRKSGADGPVIKPIGQWSGANQGFYDKFRVWLKEGGYSTSAVTLYSVSARLALGLLDKGYWLIDPETDQVLGVGKSDAAPSAVAAHLRLAAVGVEISHPKLCDTLSSRSDDDQAVGADTEAPVTEK